MEEIHRLLCPDGTLIEIHPVHGAWVEARSYTATTFVEFDPGFDSDEEVSTDNALRTILDRGLFALGADREFELLWHASSVRELRDHFAMIGGYDESPENPMITRLRNQLYRRAQETMDRLRTDAQVVYREQARIFRLSPRDRGPRPKPSRRSRGVRDALVSSEASREVADANRRDGQGVD